MRRARTSLPLAVQLLAPASSLQTLQAHAPSPSVVSLPLPSPSSSASPTPAPPNTRQNSAIKSAPPTSASTPTHTAPPNTRQNSAKSAPSTSAPTPRPALSKSPSVTATSCLPPLFETPTPELVALHDKLYHFLALILRAYVLQWYSKISPRDTQPLPEINNALVPILRPLLDVHREELVDLLLLHAPALLTLHLQTLRQAQAAVPLPATSYISTATPNAVPTVQNPEEPEQAGIDEVLDGMREEEERLGDAYHARLPLRSVTRQDGHWTVDPEYYVALGLRLQPEGGELQKTIVAELLAGSVLGNVSKRIGMPWFWAQMLHKQLSPKSFSDADSEPAEVTQPRRTIVQKTKAVVGKMKATGQTVRGLYATWASSPPPERKHTHLAMPWVHLLRELLAIDRAGLFTRLAFALFGMLVLLLSPVVDRILPILVTQTLTPALGMRILALLERIIFPCDGYPSPDEFREPGPPEQALLWEQLREDVRRKAPWMGVFGEGWDERLLDVVGHRGPNAHLAAMLYDAVVGTLAPELLVESK
ncbi:hypothetical protein A1Q2_06877 [Trichosporon asahii var. asahii CBS 8904]|uniref:PXA domain-containing protein n=1 Tax=Trichosporon asahii var. asahii (strain CBS 8904) TaxID=1220162 RepID=K1VDD1_TRIAC|nr:hypothetical protein A1Q2_06877 [Trichosporon asahii var. asahii CBS 8904]